jgi:uncharacterized hydrophobic protein (TIGR00271 family)
LPITVFSSIAESEKTAAVERLIEGSTPSQDFFLMVILAVLMATLGLLLNSTSVIIGSMLIAPILHPILSFSLGITMVDIPLILLSLRTFLISVILAILFGIGATILFGYETVLLNSEIISRTHVNELHLAIAVIAGLAASFALVKEKLSETVPGIAISVALIPPLGVSAIGFATKDWETALGALANFGVNTIGIVVASIIIFTLMHFYSERNKADQTIKKEDIKLKREVSEAATGKKSISKRKTKTKKKKKGLLKRILG